MIAAIAIAVTLAAALLFLIAVRLHPRRPQLAAVLLSTAIALAVLSIAIAMLGAGMELAP